MQLNCVHYPSMSKYFRLYHLALFVALLCICYHVYTLYFSQYKLALFVAEMDLCICAARYFSTDRELFRDLKITATDPGLQGVQLFILYVFVCSYFLSLHLVFEYFLFIYWNLKKKIATVIRV